MRSWLEIRWGDIQAIEERVVINMEKQAFAIISEEV